jgi:hypothetical protein
VITAAAAIMVSVFGVFIFDPNVFIKQIGLGLTAAVLIDATLVRMVLVPATMELLGNAKTGGCPAGSTGSSQQSTSKPQPTSTPPSHLYWMPNRSTPEHPVHSAQTRGPRGGSATQQCCPAASERRHTATAGAEHLGQPTEQPEAPRHGTHAAPWTGAPILVASAAAEFDESPRDRWL